MQQWDITPFSEPATVAAMPALLTFEAGADGSQRPTTPVHLRTWMAHEGAITSLEFVNQDKVLEDAQAKARQAKPRPPSRRAIATARQGRAQNRPNPEQRA